MQNLNDLWPAVAAVAAAFQTLILVGAFWYGARQVRQIGQQIKISRITSIRDELREVNALLLQRERQAKEVGETPESVFASIILNTFHTWYEFHREDLLDDGEWRMDYAVITDYMSWPIMYEHWLGRQTDTPEEQEMAKQKGHRIYYEPSFRGVIDCAIREETRVNHGLKIECQCRKGIWAPKTTDRKRGSRTKR